ncbi:GIN domain-containing protein [Yoonia sp. SS1-5]|uniref:GIN domain-containing protein n=1 Tax=Yoonia rhodophyticola TaxID=3137370 RepID=A0AAN0M8N3_9RHOB
MTRTAVALAIGLAMAGQAALSQEAALDVGPFRALEVQEDVLLDVSIGPIQTINATPIKGDLAQLRTREFLPWVVFDRDTRWFIFPQWREDIFQVSVETPVLNGLKAFDGAQARFSGDADQRLWIEAGAGGGVALDDVVVHELTLVARAGGTITAQGRCAMLTIRNEGLSVDASELTCDSVVVNGDPAHVTLAPGTIVVDAHPDPAS